MTRTELLQRVRIMRFMETYDGWQKGRLTQSEAALILGVHERTFWRYVRRFEQDSVDGLYGKGITQVSHRCAPVDEVMRMTEQYHARYSGWDVKHYSSFFQKEGGRRS